MRATTLDFRTSVSNNTQLRYHVFANFPPARSCLKCFRPPSCQTCTLPLRQRFALTEDSSENKNHATTGRRVRSIRGESPGIVGRTNAKRVPNTEMKLVSEDVDSWSSPSRFKSTVSTSHQVEGKPAIPRTTNIWNHIRQHA